MRSIIVCSDDAGWNEENDAVISALGIDGRVSAISILVDGATAPQWRSFPQVDSCALGLHFNLTLQTQRQSKGLFTLIIGAYSRRLSMVDLSGEVQRQLIRFERLLSRPPIFIDGHQHVHVLPMVRHALLESLAKRYGVHDRPAIRVPLSGSWRGIKAGTINVLGSRRLDAELRRTGWPANRDFAGVYNLAKPEAFRQRMQGWLSTIKDGGLIMTHPGRAEAFEHAAARMQESQYLASQEWSEDRLAAGVQLVPFTGRALHGRQTESHCRGSS